jgi:hypothetical protein
VDVPTDLEDDLRRPAAEPTGRHERNVRHARRIAPLAAAIGVIVAATIGLVLTRVNETVPSRPTMPAISTTVLTTH